MLGYVVVMFGVQFIICLGMLLASIADRERLWVRVSSLGVITSPFGFVILPVALVFGLGWCVKALTQAVIRIGWSN